MTWALRQRASVGRIVQRFGGGATATVRRTHGLFNRATDDEVSTLAVNGVTAAGASSIDLDGSNVAGWMRKNITFTIAGDGTTYTVAADLEAASQALTGLTFTPVLASEAADDAAVTITAQYADYTVPVLVGSFRDLDVDGTVVQAGDRKVILDTAALGFDLSDDDLLILPGETKPREVREMRPWRPGTQTAGHRATVGA